MGEPLEVHEYERFTPLKVQRGLGGRYRNVRPGDCIVAFSRKDIFTIKQVGRRVAEPHRSIAAATCLCSALDRVPSNGRRAKLACVALAPRNFVPQLSTQRCLS